jgi:hypothetical protein
MPAWNPERDDGYRPLIDRLTAAHF